MIASELRGWSVGARRGPDWTIVVGTSKRAKTWASSQPVGPPPRTSRLGGNSRASVASRFVQIGTSAMPSSGGIFEPDPTAMTTFVAASSWVVPSWLTATAPRPVIRAAPR